MPEEDRTARPAPRLGALDLLRGAAVAGMILVDSPGDWKHVYAPLRHAEWNGWTAADLVFPAFLFSVGAALGLSFPRPFDAPGDRRRYWGRVGRRVLVLIAIGLALEATGDLSIALGAPRTGGADLSHLRLPGVLQRIALCYAMTAALLAATARRLEDGRREVSAGTVVAAVLSVLAGYWALVRFVPVPGMGVGRLDPAGSLPAWIDRTVFGASHLYALASAQPGGPPVFDPEGLLSTFPATTDCLLGVLAALAWRRRGGAAFGPMAAAGAGLFAAALLLGRVVPTNKQLWTPSFALLSGGLSTVALAALGVADRAPLVARAMKPLRVLGGNAILAFILSTLIDRVINFPLIPEEGGAVEPVERLLDAWSRVATDPTLASLLCAVTLLAVVTLAIWPLHHRAIHLRV